MPSMASMAIVALNAALGFFHLGLVFMDLSISWSARPQNP